MWEHDDMLCIPLVNIFLIISFIVFLSNKMAGTWVILESKKFLPKILWQYKFHPPPNFVFEDYIPLSNIGNTIQRW